MENSKKFHDDIKNELSKLSELSAELNNEKTEYDCTEIPTEHKPTPEPITEPYEQKVGDRFEGVDDTWKIEAVKNNEIKLRIEGTEISGWFDRGSIEKEIKYGNLKKVN